MAAEAAGRYGGGIIITPEYKLAARACRSPGAPGAPRLWRDKLPAHTPANLTPTLRVSPSPSTERGLRNAKGVRSLAFRHLGGAGLVVEQDEPFDPLNIRLNMLDTSGLAR